jgi:predicted transcriptional regulator
MTNGQSPSTGHAPLSLDELDALSRVGKLLHARDLHMLPPSQWLIDGVLLTNKLTELFGMPGQGKSFTNLDIALSIAQFANVVYIAAEDAEDYAERVEAWCTHHKAGPGGLHFWPEAVNLFDQLATSNFLAEVTPLTPALIVFDPLANCMVGGDESSTKDMAIAVDALNTIRRQTQAAILICHHTGWNDAHERGSSVLRAACRVVMKLANNDGLLTLTCEKINGGKAFEPRHFHLIPSAHSVVPVPTSKITMRDAPITQKQIDVLDALNLSIFTQGATFTQLVEHLNVAKSSLNYSLTKLKDHAYIMQKVERAVHRYFITEEGKDILCAEELEAVQSSSVQFNATPHETELTLNWHINAEAIRSGSVQSHSAAHERSSVEFSPCSVSVQSNGSSSVQPPPFKGAERLNTELNGTAPANGENHHD